ncbi:hypothetical protein ACP4OV_006757 [Aristida adscensionis]
MSEENGSAARALDPLVGDVDQRDLQEMTLVIRTGDRTIHIPLQGNMQAIMPHNDSSAQAPPPEAEATGGGGGGAANDGPVVANSREEEEDSLQMEKRRKREEERAYLDNMRGWLVTVATLFIGIAYQAAMQPPPWMPSTQDWSSAFADEKRYRALSPGERSLVNRAISYQFFNTVTFSSALAMVVLLLLMGESSPRRVLWGAKALVAVISASLTKNFMDGITGYTNAARMFWVFGAVYAFNAACLLYGVPLLISFLQRRNRMARARRSGGQARNTAGPGASHDQQHAQPAETQLRIQDTHPASN